MKKILIVLIVFVVFLVSSRSYANSFISDTGEESCYTGTDVAYKFSLVSYIEGSSSSSSINSAGHSFIYIQNVTSLEMSIAGVTIAPYSDVSFGTYGNVDPNGLWVNRERYIMGGQTISNNIAVLTRDIIFYDKYIIDNVITWYTEWEVTKNCSYYAVNVWNVLFNDDLSATESFGIPTPTGLYNDMIDEPNCKTSIFISSSQNNFAFSQ